MAESDWADEWELCNDDGFVYKRRKRRLNHHEDGLAASARLPPQADPMDEESSMRARRKRALLKLRDKYQREISQWENLSNTLRAMQEKAQQPQQQHEQEFQPQEQEFQLQEQKEQQEQEEWQEQKEREFQQLEQEFQQQEPEFQPQEQEERTGSPSSSSPALPSPSGDSREPAPGAVIDELLLQAEAQEAMICEVSNLCDVAEAMSKELEDMLAQSFLDLTIWASPRELVGSLCDD